MKEQSLGKTIANLRKQNNLTQAELAAQMNVTDKAVSKWERDISCPDVKSIPRLAEVLGTSVEALIKTSAGGAQREKGGYGNSFSVQSDPTGHGHCGGCYGNFKGN